jgi:riboflavin kinase/FMN adenylyltransferase
MQVVSEMRQQILTASVVTFGMFDGVHRGHQALLQQCRHAASLRALPSVVLTYEPHPSQILHPENPIPLLTPLREKLARLEEAGIAYTLIPQFTRQFSLLSPDAFIAEVLVAALHPVLVVAGYRSTFGHARAGNVEALRELGARYGFMVEVVQPIDVAGGAVSSTRIRQCLADGHVELAAELLGYGYAVTGLVMPGDQRGRQIGIPTANLEPLSEKLIPADGVYAVEVPLPAGTFRGVMNIGNRPTFARPRTLEVHLLDYAGDLYGQELTVIFRKRLRDVRPFATPGALVAQIQADIAAARLGVCLTQRRKDIR